MSLINEMLKDLEARGSGGNAGAGPVRASRTNRTSRGHGPVLFLLALLVLLLGGALAYLLWPAPAQTRTTTIAVVPADAPAPAVDVEVPATLATNGDPAAETPPQPIDAPHAAPAAADDANVFVAQTDDIAPAKTDAVPEPLVASGEAAASAPDTVIVRKHELTPDEKALRTAREGFAALRRGDWLTASRLLQELIAVEPGNDDAREGLVVALMRQGRVAETDGVLLDGFAVADDPARFAKLRARLQASRGEFDAAFDSLSVAVPSIAADPEYHALKGAIAQQGGHYERAARIYRELTAFEPANATWQAGLGMALDRLSDIEGALAAYERALQAGGLEAALLEHVRQRQGALADTKE